MPTEPIITLLQVYATFFSEVTVLCCYQAKPNTPSIAFCRQPAWERDPGDGTSALYYSTTTKLLLVEKSAGRLPSPIHSLAEPSLKVCCVFLLSGEINQSSVTFLVLWLVIIRYWFNIILRWCPRDECKITEIPLHQSQTQYTQGTHRDAWIPLL